MDSKPTRNADPKSKAKPAVPLTPDQADLVKGGLGKLGDIKGESTDKDHSR